MSESLFSPSWYRVATLKPRLRGHTRIHRHNYRGERWYVLQDHVTGRFSRFTPMAYQVIGLMDGHLTVQEIWERSADRFGDDGPSQGEVIRLLTQLNQADVLICDVPPDTAELFRRQEKISHSRWKMNVKSPLFMRFSLLDPERFLSRTIGIIRPFFSIYGAILWVIVVSTAAILAGSHWPDLTENVADRLLSAENMLMMWLVFPAVKTLHELGHAYAVKVRGGEVHEMGIMLLVLMPVPYMDASSASAFRGKWQRVLVGAAGMMTELFVASLALFLWLDMSEGNLRAVLYNVILIASVSTLLFNANPLLRYDGYYILSDLTEIPNFSHRSMAYLGYLFKRYLFGVKTAEPPYAARGEPVWFVTYSVASFIYRMFLYAAIILLIAGKFFFIGVLLAIWAFANMVLIPVFRRIGFVMYSPMLREKRVRAVMASGVLLLMLLAVFFFVPLPLRTMAQGVVWAPDDALVRAGVDGFVHEINVRSGAWVKKGDMLIECRDPLLSANVRILNARLRELTFRYHAQNISLDRVQARIIEEEVDQVRANLARAEERMTQLTLYSPSDGIFILPKAEDLPGRYLRQGEGVAYLLNADHPMARAVVRESDMDMVRHRTKKIEVRLAEQVERVIPATIIREVPGVAGELPSTILSQAGGGDIAIDPTDTAGKRTIEKFYQLYIRLDEPVDTLYMGARVYIRFDHGFEPLAFRCYRLVRQLFLRRFNV